MFVGGPEIMNPGETSRVGLALMFYPDEKYADVRPGATFTVREGSLIVGFGTVLSDPGESSNPLSPSRPEF
jgi:hypothetical protein